MDASGWVGWFSGRQVVNGDGLVNDHDYARRLSERRLAGYLKEQGIRYIVQNLYPENGMLIGDCGGLTVSMDSVETLVPPPPGFPDLSAFRLHRLKVRDATQDRLADAHGVAGGEGTGGEARAPAPIGGALGSQVLARHGQAPRPRGRGPGARNQRSRLPAEVGTPRPLLGDDERVRSGLEA